MPPKLAESTPWETLCVELVGPYTVSIDGTDRVLWEMTFIDPTTGWFEVAEIPDKKSGKMSHTLDTVWLSQYPRAKK